MVYRKYVIIAHNCYLQVDHVIVLLHQHLGIMLPLCDQLLTQAICLLEKSEKDNMEYIIGILKKSEHRGKYSSAGSVGSDEAASRIT